MASSVSGTVSSSSCTYQVFVIAGPTTIQSAVEAAGLTYVRARGFYRKSAGVRLRPVLPRSVNPLQ